jgi:hypothetical protein
MLSPHDILLHRLCPISGQTARIADVFLALVLSAPGLAWLANFMSRFSAVGWVLWAVFTLIWMTMLGRTASKAWVPPLCSTGHDWPACASLAGRSARPCCWESSHGFLLRPG